MSADILLPLAGLSLLLASFVALGIRTERVRTTRGEVPADESE